jgi:hypothetical protein
MMDLNLYRVRNGLLASDDGLGKTGAFRVGSLNILAFFPDPHGWEHVIVSRSDHTPSWEEMCEVKDLFWDAEAVVWQYHPAKSEHTNVHPFALHLWKKCNFEMPMPPSIFAEVKT